MFHLSNRPLGKCGGYKAKTTPSGGIFGYGNWDIFYLEVCIFNHICQNGRELFTLKAGQTFNCDFSASKFLSLKSTLTSKIGPEPADASLCRPTPKPIA